MFRMDRRPGRPTSTNPTYAKITEEDFEGAMSDPKRTLKYAIDALRQRRQRPVMFLRDESVTELLVFLAGYSFGR